MSQPAPIPAPPSRPEGPQALAAIDIGTNTIRLLVAAPATTGDGVAFTPLETRTATVRLGLGVERTGRLDPERMTRAVATVEEFRRTALAHGARAILLAATSAVRDAANGAELRGRIAATSGLTIEIIDGEREAALTFAGATAGQSLAGTVLVGDLGGGSLELIVARDGAVRSARSLQIGSGRLTERHMASDPPDRAMITAAEADARETIAPHAAASPPVDRLILVGGTAASLPSLAPESDGARILTGRRLGVALAVLTAAPAARVAAETGLDPERVRVLPAGVAIFRALFAAYGLDSALIGSGGIREGLIMEYLRQGEARRASDERRATSDD